MIYLLLKEKQLTMSLFKQKIHQASKLRYIIVHYHTTVKPSSAITSLFLPHCLR